MAGLCAPLSTLRQYPRGYLRMTRGRCGSLLLHRDGLAPSTPCRSPGALRSSPIKGHRQTGQSLIAAVFFGLALCGPVISTAAARSRWLLSAVQSRRNRGSAADSHPADSPAMAVPETLCHPFATAKIVVWPGTCSVRGGLIIAARSGDATLCACRRRGERTGNRCDRDKGSKCLLHSRPSCACLACGHATAAPPQDTKKFPPLHVNPPAGHRIRSTECIDRGWLRVAYLQSPDVRCGSTIGIGGASRLLPSHTTVRTGPYTAVREVTLTRFDQMIRRVSAGRSGSFAAESDSMSSPAACRASPVGADEKSRLNWMFSRLSLSRFMSYLPLLSFGPSAIVSGSAYLLSPPFGMECLTSLADDMAHYALC